MKRGIVMEIRRNKAVILTQNGVFQTVRFNKRNGTPYIGEEMIVPAVHNAVRMSKHWLPAIAGLAIIFIFVVLLSGFYPSPPNKSVAAYVSYDVNPSFSAAVNGDMQVVSVQAWNNEADDLFAGWGAYQFMGLKEFSDEVLQKIKQSGYLRDQSEVLLATAIVASNKNKRNQIASSLQKTLKKFRSGSAIRKNHVQLSVKNSDLPTRKKANESGLSLGKYLLYLDAAKKNKDVSISTVKHSSISDIHNKI